MFKSSRLLFTALLSLSCFASRAQRFQPARLDSLLTSLAANQKMMGSLTLSHKGNVFYSRAFGYAQAVGPTPIAATPATRYRVGSLSKVFTATMIMQLIEENKLTLSPSLATFFPELPNAQAITIDHLLSHRSGLHNFTSDPAYQSYKTQPQTRAEMVAIMAQTKADFEPSAKYAYSNSGYVVLSYIVEQLTKLSYAKALRKRVVAKAHLKGTYYGGKIGLQKHEALSYVSSPAGWKPSSETDMSIPTGAGAVVSTPADLDRFLEALFGGKLVSAASLEQMQTMRDGYGLGLRLMPFSTKKNYGHGGTIDGFRSSASYFPDDKLAVALCSNAVAYPINDVLLGVLRIYFNKPYKIPDFTPSTYVPTLPDLDRYVGTYASAKNPLKITVTRDGTALTAQTTGQSALLMEAVRKDVFKFDPAGIQYEFEAVKPAFLLKQGGHDYEYVKE